MFSRQRRGDGEGAPIRFAVVGDLMLDRTFWSQAEDLREHSFGGPETWTAAQPGGAGYVARLLRAFGAEVDLFGITGADAEGIALCHQLRGEGIQTFTASDSGRPTTVKSRLFAGTPAAPHLLSRVDRETTRDLNQLHERRLLEHFSSRADGYAGVIVSDYAKGVCTRSLMRSLFRQANICQCPVMIDPARRESFARYRGANVLTPNRTEAETATSIAINSVDDARRAGSVICRRTDAGACLVTLDADGAVLVSQGNEWQWIPPAEVMVVDSCGAGDAFIASLATQICRGIDLQRAAEAACQLAGIQVSRFGTDLLDRKDLEIAVRISQSPHSTQKKVGTLQEVALRVRSAREAGRQVVLTNGCFDLLHPGHVDYLEQAKALGQFLVVAVNSDESVRLLKGAGRPVMSAVERARMLAGLDAVDAVVIFEESTPLAVIETLRPHVLAKGGDYSLADVVGREEVEAYGGKVMTLGLTAELSTTSVLQRVTLTNRLPIAG